jgi:SAM-dependent methyltransferase
MPSAPAPSTEQEGLERARAVDRANAEFWDELCGTQLARELGIVDRSAASLKKFDDWYFSYYPYLSAHIPFQEMADRRVLEVGLGYGTVSQRIAEVGARYEGLDIAANPVAMVNHRLRQAGLPGEARQGSILAAPFPDEHFDFIVAIGCLHHTGDLPAAIEECRRMLRTGGKLIFMVYYAYSYRRFYQSRWPTLRYLLLELFGYRGVVGQSREKERAAYDGNDTGEAPPHTDWISVRSLRHLCRRFNTFSARTENIDNGPPFEKRQRSELLNTRYPQWFGLDVYATASK